MVRVDTLGVIQIPWMGQRASESIGEDGGEAPTNGDGKNDPDDDSMGFLRTEPCSEDDC